MPNAADFYDAEGRLDALGWSNALIGYARASHEADPEDDLDELAEEILDLGERNAQLGAENLALLAENRALRARLDASGNRSGGPPESNHTAKERTRRSVRRGIAGHFESKRARHR